MPYEFYKLVHIFGLLLVFSGLAGAIAISLSGTTQLGSSKKLVFMSHGIGLVIMLIGGFGMAARLGLMASWPNWLSVKVLVWILLGGIVALIKRKPKMASALYVVVLLLGSLATYMAIYKPF